MDSGCIVNTAQSGGVALFNAAGTVIMKGGSLQCKGDVAQGIWNGTGASLLLNGGTIQVSGDSGVGIFSLFGSNFQMEGEPVIEASRVDLKLDSSVQIRVTGALTGDETYTLDYYDGVGSAFATASNASYLSNAKEKFVPIEEGMEVLVDETSEEATLDYKKGQLSISVTWEDEDDKLEVRPQLISACIYKEDGTETGEYIEAIDIQPDTSSADSNVWTVTKEVYLYDEDGSITYRVELNGFSDEYVVNELPAEDGFAFEMSLAHFHELQVINPTVDGVVQRDIVEIVCVNAKGNCNWSIIGVQLQAPATVMYDGSAKQATINNWLGDSAVAQDVFLSAIVYERWDATEEWVAIGADEVVGAGNYRAKVTVSYGTSSIATAQVEFAIEALTIGVQTGVCDAFFDPFAPAEGIPAVDVRVMDESIPATIEYSVDGGEFSTEVPMVTGVCDMVVTVKITAENYEEYVEEVSVLVEPYDLNGCVLMLEQDSYYYTGQEIQPKVVDILSINGLSLPLTEADYTISYSNNIGTGDSDITQAEVILTPTNPNYTDSAVRKFPIILYDGNVEILYNGSELQDWYTGFVEITADGYQVKLAGEEEFTDSVLINTEGENQSREVVFCQEGTGYITDVYQVTVNIDGTGPAFDMDDTGIWLDEENRWTTDTSEISYDIFRKKTTKVYLGAEDAYQSVEGLYYYLDASGSETVLTEEQLDALKAEGKFTKLPQEDSYFELDTDGTYVVYLYATDALGNPSAFICSNGIVIDTKAPVVEVSVPSEEAGTLKDTSVTFSVKADEDAIALLQIIYNYSGEEIEVLLSTELPEEAFEYYEGFAFGEQFEIDKTDLEILAIGYKVALKAGEAQTFTITGLQPNTEYMYSMIIYDEAHNVFVVASPTEEEGIYDNLPFTTLKTVPTFDEAPTITGTYGDKLSEMTLSQPVSTNGVKGYWSIAYAGAGQHFDIPAVDGTTAYEVKFTPEDADTYEAVFVQVVPDVEKMPLTVTVDNQTKKYGEENPELTYVITEGSIVDANYAGRPRLTITLSTTATQTSDTGTYDITGVVSNDVNYDVTIQKGILTIEKAETVLAVENGKDAYTKTFGDESFALSGISTNSDAAFTYAVVNSKNVAGQSVANDQILTVSANGKVTVVGAGSAEIVVSTAETTNYKAADVTITVDVAKAVHNVEPLERGYAYNKENADAIDLATYVPTDADNVNYIITQKAGTASFAVEPTVDADGMLTYTLAKGTKGQHATIDISISSDNYTDFHIIVELDLSYEVHVELKAGSEVTAVGELTYGDTLSKLTFGEAVFVEEGTDTEVTGTLRWELPDSVPKVAITTANWIFTPTNTDYAPVTGNTDIVVNKAKQPKLTIVPVSATYGQEDSVWFETTGGLDGAEISITVPENNGVVTAVNTNGLGQFFAVPLSVGKVTVTAVAKDASGNYEDEIAVYELTVAPATLSNVSWAGEFSGTDTYTGKALTPVVEAYFIADGNLAEGTDYTVEYVNNTNAYIGAEDDADFDSSKAPAAVVTGKGNYTGIVTLYFVINKAENAPNMPASAMTVANDISSAGQVSLPEGWIWQEPSVGLKEGSETVAIAIYDGADKGNYVNELLVVTITRLEATPTPTPEATPEATPEVTPTPTTAPTLAPTTAPTLAPTTAPTLAPTTAPTSAPATPSTSKSPQTGDTFEMEVMMLFVALMTFGLSSAYVKRKRNNR